MKFINNKWLFLFLMIVALSCENMMNQDIMIDGDISEKEWRISKKIQRYFYNTIFYKETANYSYLALDSKLPKPLFIDVFIKINDTLLNIHASSQLGDRVLTDSIWNDDCQEIKWAIIKVGLLI